MADGARSYSDEELEAILRRALERQSSGGATFGHDELVAAAREVGLDEAALERAIDELSRERSSDEIRRSLRRKRRQQWVRHLVSYLAVVGAFLGLHALALTGTWVFWMAAGWGVGLALDTYSKLRAPTDEEVERERERLNRHERRRAKAEARREAKRRQAEERARRAARKHQPSEAGEQLGRAIEEGVALLLAAAAKKLREATDEMDRGGRAADTDFGRYVARKRDEAHAAHEPGVPREPVRVRVEEGASPEVHEEEREDARRSRRERRHDHRQR